LLTRELGSEFESVQSMSKMRSPTTDDYPYKLHVIGGGKIVAGH
jgi:hypothetical protein